MPTYSTVDLVEDLAQATDLELAIAYDHSDDEDTLYPFWMCDAERRHRDLDLTDLEGLLDTLSD